nr:FMN-binding protein [Sedimentibacter sp.]
MKKISLLLALALMTFSVAACSSKEAAAPAAEPAEKPAAVEPAEKPAEEPAKETEETAAPEGALTGTAKGFGGDVTVTVVVDGDDIVSVEAVGASETQGVGSNAIDQLPAKIAEADSTEVDGVSGATVTSNAIKEAVNAALASK